MNILLAPNSYKECSDSVEIAKIISSSFGNDTSFNIIEKPLTDGGDGFLKICKKLFNTSELTSIKTIGYSIDLSKYPIEFSSEAKAVFIESALLFGLRKVNKINRNPLYLNSEVLGKMLSMLINAVNAKKININTLWVGIGGTATIDFGMGACSQLGLKLLDDFGNPIQAIPKNFIDVRDLILEKIVLPFNIKCVVDVDTPLIGNPGAIEIYGRQKGGSEKDLILIKNGVNNLINLLSANSDINVPDKLNGAGGGIATGLNLLFNAEILPAELFINNYLLNSLKLSEIDAVISGEGCFDLQSFEGKGSGIILKLFKDKSIPIFFINGSTNLPSDRFLPQNVTIINMIDFFNNKQESIKNFKIGFEKSVQIVKNQLNY